MLNDSAMGWSGEEAGGRERETPKEAPIDWERTGRIRLDARTTDEAGEGSEEAVMEGE